MLYLRRRGSLRSVALAFASVLALVGCGEPSDDEEMPAPVAPAMHRGGSAPALGVGYPHGDSAALLTVYEFSDFGCRYCAEFAAETLPELEREFITSGRVRWMFVPVASGAYPNGEEAARAAVCAGVQQRFWEMHHVLFETQRDWTSRRDPYPLLLGYAEQVGLDRGLFAACYGGEEAGSVLAQAGRTALLFGVRAYPSFFVGGRLIEGALPADAFRGVLTRALPDVASEARIER